MPNKLLLIFAPLLSSYLQVAGNQHLFLAHNRDAALVSYAIDPEEGTLKKHSSLELTGTGGPMSLTRDGHQG